MAKALLFDMGGVVLDVDFARAFAHWSRYSRLSAEEIGSRFRMDDAYERHERNEILAAEYFAHLRDTLALEADDMAILAGWNAIFVGEIDAAVALVLAARQQLPCYAFTNSNASHQVAWTSAYPKLVLAFDKVFSSNDLGLRKPERVAFQAVCAAIDTDPADILFFDDLQENVSAARAAGLQAVHVTATEDIRAALSSINALP